VPTTFLVAAVAVLVLWAKMETLTALVAVMVVMVLPLQSLEHL
jgi:hypothetical protein